MNRRNHAAALVFMTAALCLGGCQGSRLTGIDQTTLQEREKTKLTVSVWDNENSPQFEAVAKAYMEKNPEIQIELLDAQTDDYDNKLTIMLAGSDTDPDVIMVKNTETQVTMKEKNQLLDLTEYLVRDKVDLSVYSGIAEQLQMDGRQYTLPFRQDWYVLYYNKDMFDAAGIPYPKDDMTWMEYEELARQMTSGEGSSKQYGSHNHTWMALVSNWAVQDGKNTLMNQDYTFLKPWYEQALRMQEDGVIQSYANLKTGNVHYISVFEQQQCAMLPMGTWFIASLIQDQEDGTFDFEWGVTRIPHPEGIAPGSTVGSVTSMAINAKTDAPDQAWEFVKFAAGEDGAKILAANSVLPAISSEAVLNCLDSVHGFPEDGKAALEVSKFVFDRPMDAKMAAVRKVIEEEHEKIMIGEESVDMGIANMEKRAGEVRKE